MLQTPMTLEYFYLQQHKHHFHGNMLFKLQIEDCNFLSNRRSNGGFFPNQLVATFMRKMISHNKSFKSYIIIKAILKLSMVSLKIKESEVQLFNGNEDHVMISSLLL